MCEYCKNINNTGIAFPLVDGDADCGIMGLMNVSAYLRLRDNKPVIEVTMNGYRLSGRTYRVTQEINYCPGCGKKLEGAK